MSTAEITVVEEPQRELTLSVLAMSYMADPVTRWIFPSADVFLDNFRRFANAFGGGAIGSGSAYLADGHRGAALWLPPGLESDDETMAEMLAQYATESVMADIPGFMGEMAEYHPHDEDCWYLAMIGVDPAYQGQGVGAQLMKHVLQGIDERSELAYLESSNPQNISLYQRHGFEVMGTIEVGNSPKMYPMLRPRR